MTRKNNVAARVGGVGVPVVNLNEAKRWIVEYSVSETYSDARFKNQSEFSDLLYFWAHIRPACHLERKTVVEEYTLKLLHCEFSSIHFYSPFFPDP